MAISERLETLNRDRGFFLHFLQQTPAERLAWKPAGDSDDGDPTSILEITRHCISTEANFCYVMKEGKEPPHWEGNTNWADSEQFAAEGEAATVARAIDLVRSRIRGTRGEGGWIWRQCRSWIGTERHDDVDRIRDIDLSAVVDVCGVVALERNPVPEEVFQDSMSVGNRNNTVPVHVSPEEIDGWQGRREPAHATKQSRNDRTESQATQPPLLHPSE